MPSPPAVAPFRAYAMMKKRPDGGIYKAAESISRFYALEPQGIRKIERLSRSIQAVILLNATILKRKKII
jgi:hypothetical protein